MFTPHTTCRACGYGPPANAHYFKSETSKDKLESILNLGSLPLANSFPRGLDPRPGHYPLELLACPKCHLGQLSVVVDPVTLYSNYLYVTSTSQTLEDHILLLHEWLRGLGSFKSVVEIGSNDGRVLQIMRRLGAEFVLGIDPAKNLAKKATEDGIQTIDGMFDRDSVGRASDILSPVGADLILARHVFCHVDNWKEFLRNAALLSHGTTMLCIEAPWAHDTIQKVEWDQIYHEHLSYFTLRALDFAVKGTGWKLYAVRRFAIHGGALAVVLVPDLSDIRLPNNSVEEYMELERCAPGNWKGFALQAVSQQNNLKQMINELLENHQKIAGYGATAKSTTWANVLKLNRSQIYGFYDSTSLKQYTTVPGTDIPVIPEGGFYVDNPDVAIIWAWNFAEEIIRKNVKWTSQGGRFILPVPTPKFV